MKKLWVHSILLVFMTGTAQAAPLADAAVERPVQTALQASQLPGMRRFVYMRYYQPSERLSSQAANSESDHVRALAMYIVNMYVSVRLYGALPEQFTLDFLGVLDGFEKQGAKFNFSQGSSFYNTHQQAVDALVSQHLKARPYPWPAPTQEERLQWVALLQQVPLRQGQAVFDFPVNTRLSRPLPPSGQAALESVLHKAQALLRKQAIVYDEPDMKLEDLDSHIGNHAYRRKRTYRWVKDECYYSSYLLAKQLTQAIVKDRTAWKNTHLYLLTATPKQGEFLRPAQGERFQLADGTPGLHWRYHTAVLVVLQREEGPALAVLDTFLAGGKPVSLATWLTHFHAQTQFRAQPFARSKTVEDFLKIPSKTEGNAIWADGYKYLPAEVVR